MKRICSFCGKEFSFPGRQPRKKFCSRICYVSYRRSRRPTAESLRKLYCEDQLSLSLVGKELGVSQSTIFEAMRFYGIQTRPARDAVILIHQQGRVNIQHRVGEKHPNWKGGRKTVTGGYIEVYNKHHPRANKHGYVREHILVWENFHNKSLPTGWVVHHLNGITSDNRPENLVALTAKKHNLVFKAKAERIKQLEAEVKEFQAVTEAYDAIMKERKAEEAAKKGG